MATLNVSRGLNKSSTFLDKLFRRTLIEKTYPSSEDYNELIKSMLKKPVAVYSGFDATSNSLHVGNLATIMNLIHFQREGHQVICVIGDATTQIGDPSGHYKDRNRIDKEVIDQNASSIEETLKRLFKNHRKCFLDPMRKSNVKDPIIVRNSSWYKGKEVTDFVGEIFREVRIGTLLHKRSIQERIKSQEGMNMSEFCYQIFQAYDWLKLRQLYDCRFQVGGSDQGGNIYTGHDVIKKMTGKKDAIGLLAPLITSRTGLKLGKTSKDANSNIWLSPKRTSPFNLYQFFHRTPDKDVEKYLKVFSLHDEKTIEDLIYNHLKKSQDVWHCQKKLAEHVCQLVHGEAGLQSAQRLTTAFYHRNALEIANLNDEELEELFDEKSVVKLVHVNGMRAIDLIRRAGCFDSDSQAERMIEAGAIYLNNAQVTSINVPITEDLIIGNGITVMRVGKRNYFLFKWSK